jgi:polyhydroxyalkanoate synthesis regulator phasin
VEAAQKLAKYFDIPAEMIDRVQTQKGDPPTRAMHQREAMADLLDKYVNGVEALRAEIKALQAEVEALKTPEKEKPAAEEAKPKATRGKRGSSK